MAYTSLWNIGQTEPQRSKVDPELPPRPRLGDRLLPPESPGAGLGSLILSTALLPSLSQENHFLFFPVEEKC